MRRGQVEGVESMTECGRKASNAEEASWALETERVGRVVSRTKTAWVTDSRVGPGPGPKRDEELEVR